MVRDICLILSVFLTVSCATTEKWNHEVFYTGQLFGDNEIVAYILTTCEGIECKTEECTDDTFSSCKTLTKCAKNQLDFAEFRNTLGAVSGVKVCRDVDLNAKYGGQIVTAKYEYSIEFDRDEVEEMTKDGFRLALDQVKTVSITHDTDSKGGICRHKGVESVAFVETKGKKIRPRYQSSSRRNDVVDRIECEFPEELSGFVNTQ